MLSGAQFLEYVNFDELNVISVKNASDRWAKPGFLKKLYKQDHLNV